MRRVLAIDGGGVKGVFAAAFLAAVEESIDVPIWEYFDLIVGTSTGGIIALALGLSLSARDILAFYERLSRSVFGAQRLSLLQRPFVSAYHAKKLYCALSEVFGERKLGESKTRLVIPASNLETGQIYLYKTSHDVRFERDFRQLALDVAMATSAAPTYFPAFRSRDGLPMVDGGIWANNPAGVAAVEAVGVLKWDATDTQLLSLGCTTEPLDLGRARIASLGTFYWARKVSALFMATQSSGSIGTASVLLGHDKLLRIDPTVPPGRFKFDTIDEIVSLRGLGYEQARQHLPTIRARFLQKKAEIFVPFHEE